MTYQSITVPGQLDSLSAIRDFVKRASADAGLAKQRAYRLMLAVDEIAANIVIHGYDEAGRQGDIEAGFEIDDERLRVHLFDRALPYDPNQNHKPDHLNQPLEDRPIGGLGVYLAREGTDDFLYEFVDGRNHNIFVVNRTPASQNTDAP